MPNMEGLKLKRENYRMHVRSNIRNWGGFYKIKNILSGSSCTVNKMRLLTKSSEFSQTVQTPPLLVIPRKQTRTTACRGSLSLTTKSLLKNRKEKAYLGNRLCSFRLFCRHNDWNNNAGGEHLVEHTSYENNRPFPSTGESRTPSPEEPQLLCYYKEWEVNSSEMDPIPKLCSVCKNTHFEFHRSQGCLLEHQEELAQTVSVLCSRGEDPFWSLGMVLWSTLYRDPNSSW